MKTEYERWRDELEGRSAPLEWVALVFWWGAVFVLAVLAGLRFGGVL